MHRMLANTFQTIAVALIGVAGMCPRAGAQGTPAPQAPANAPSGMALIPAGIYKPLFRGENELKGIAVKPFFLDIVPVTNRDFLEFVRAEDDRVDFPSDPFGDAHKQPGHLSEAHIAHHQEVQVAASPFLSPGE